MPTIELHTEARVSDPLVPDLPLVRRIEVDETDAIVRQFPSSGSYQNLAAAHLATVKGYVLAFDAAVTVRIAGQTDAGLSVNAGGQIAAIDTAIDNSGNDAIQILYNGGGTLTVRGHVYG